MNHWPVSVKGVVIWGDEVLVLRNERGEWELPGGRLEPDDESPAAALRREFREEVALEVEVGELVDSWIYDVAGHRVLILAYECAAARPAQLSHSSEHSAVALLPVDGLPDEPLPHGYRRAIARVRSRFG